MLNKLLILLSIIFCFNQLSAQNGYNITINTEGAKGNTLLLAYYNGSPSRVAVIDSAKITKDKQIITFSNKLKKLGGIYKVSVKGVDKLNFLNLVIDNGAILKLNLIGTNCTNLTTTQILNKDFFDLQKTTDRDEKAKALNLLITKYPKSVLSLYAAIEQRKSEAFEKDKKSFVKYLSGININDNCIKLLPNTYSFLLAYINTNVVTPENYKYAVDNLLKGMNCENENYFFYLDWFFENMLYFQRNKLENTYQQVYNKYLNTTACKNKKPNLFKKIQSVVLNQGDLIIGSVMPNFKMEDSTGKAYDLTAIYTKKKYTFLVFYDPDCEHCQVKLPEVSAFFENLKQKNIAIQEVGFNIVDERKKWKKFIEDTKIQDWLNVVAYKNDHKFLTDFKIFNTPSYFLLNNEGVILLKMFNVKEIEDIIINGG